MGDAIISFTVRGSHDEKERRKYKKTCRLHPSPGYVFAPLEVVERRDALFIVTRGLAMRNGRLLRRGDVWNEDFLLPFATLEEARDRHVASTHTHRRAARCGGARPMCGFGVGFRWSGFVERGPSLRFTALRRGGGSGGIPTVPGRRSSTACV